MRVISFVCLIIFSFFSTNAGYAKEKDQAETSDLEIFFQHNPDSKIKIDYAAWSDVLGSFVLQVGQSRGRLGKQKTKTHNSSRLTFGATLPSRYENSRVFFHEFKKPQKRYIASYMLELADIPDRVSLSRLNKNEQLAYWLNLHNVIVLDGIVDKYPVSNLKRFRSKYWDKKVVVIEGVQLSLNDIEAIIMSNWDDPLVLYGLYQGAIGGPTLPGAAYTSDNVYNLLAANAKEFVNSNRGFKPGKKNRAEVSQMYEWGYRLFDNSEAVLIEHLKSYAKTPFSNGLDTVTQIKMGLYDWNIADLIGGNYYSGAHVNPAASLGIASRQGEVLSINTFLNFTTAHTPGVGTKLSNMPPGALDLLAGIAKNNYLPEKSNPGAEAN